MTEPTRPRILVVDGDASIRRSMARALADRGQAAETATDCPSALTALMRRSFALAVIDVELPRMGGRQLAAVIAERWPETAVVIASRAADAATAVGWMQAGAYDYLIKPFELGEVLVRLDRALERQREALEARRRQKQLETGALGQVRATRRLFLGAIRSLSSALEAKDDYTKGHSERVSRIAGEIARSLEVNREQVRHIRLAGRLHDIGKIGVREAVLSKPSSLTEAEYKHVQSHPLVGERILAPTLVEAEVGKMVRHHHEWFDGGGYPDGLKGSSIPLGARVLAVSDAFDALTSDRPYRQRLSPQDALRVLREGAGKQWQPTLVEALTQHLESAGSEGRQK